MAVLGTEIRRGSSRLLRDAALAAERTLTEIGHRVGTICPLASGPMALVESLAHIDPCGALRSTLAIGYDEIRTALSPLCGTSGTAPVYPENARELMSVSRLWRFPVKSMGGTEVDQMRIDRRGVHADRLWAVRDVEKGVTASARRLPALLNCSARYLTEPADDAQPGNVPPVVVTFPDGRELSSDDAEIHDALSELGGRELRLVSLPAVDDTSQHRMTMRDAVASYAPTQVRKDLGLADAEALPDVSMFALKDVITLARYSTPPGTFVDLSPLHVLTTTSLTNLSPDGTKYDVRRFRPNVLVDTSASDQEFPESGWVGGTLTVGAAVLHVTAPTIRCVVPTRPQPGVELDRTITRQLAERTNRFLGVYADVATPGVVRLGDAVSVSPARPPGLLGRTAQAIGGTVFRQGQRFIESTVLAERG